VLEALSQGLTNKLIHAPTRFLNDAEGELHGDCAELVQRLFNLHRDH
jgi:glutamyl-tRNA reductase